MIYSAVFEDDETGEFLAINVSAKCLDQARDRALLAMDEQGFGKSHILSIGRVLKKGEVGR